MTNLFLLLSLVAATALPAQAAPRPAPAPTRPQAPPDTWELEQRLQELSERAAELAQRSLEQANTWELEQHAHDLSQRALEQAHFAAELDVHDNIEFDVYDNLRFDFQYHTDFDFPLDLRVDLWSDIDMQTNRDQLGNALERSLERTATPPLPDVVLPPQGWAPDDPADSLYRLAREALNRDDYRRSANLFAELSRRFPRSVYGVDAAYWEAFARYRIRTEPELRTALRVLEAHLANNAAAKTSGEATALAVRIRGELANRADDNSARRMSAQFQRQASQPGDECDKEEAAVRIEALSALAKIDSNAIAPTARRVLANRATCATSLRERAVLLLGRHGTSDAAALLTEVARDDPSPRVRRTALASLARMPGEQPAIALEQVLRTTSDQATQLYAVSSLGANGTARATQALRNLAERTDAPQRVRSEALSALARDTTSASAAYLRELYPRLDSVRLKERILSAVARMPGVANEQWLLATARNESEAMRLRRGALAGLTRSAVSVGELSQLYESIGNRELREELIRVFARREEPEATDKLFAVARSDADPRLRRSAIAALARKDDPRTAKLLMEIIDRSPGQ